MAVALRSRERLATLAGLAGAALLAWLYLASAGLDMYGDMDGPSAWMMEASWTPRYILLIFLMWAVMMIGMMLPSVLPVVLLFDRILKHSASPDRPVARSYAFAAGYFAAWTGFALAATLLQWQLALAALVSPMMVATSPILGAVILMLAGAYQWTPLKQRCLEHCRTPLDYLQRHWHAGVGGALRMGVEHGLYCLGCCWVLMLLLFVGGVMNLIWIAGITVFVLIEKLAPVGDRVGRLSGPLLIAAGIAVIVAELASRS